MLRAQFPAGADMQVRFAELVEQARLADRLGFASITKGMHGRCSTNTASPGLSRR
jgi:hypothetical protein